MAKALSRISLVMVAPMILVLWSLRYDLGLGIRCPAFALDIGSWNCSMPTVLIKTNSQALTSCWLDISIGSDTLLFPINQGFHDQNRCHRPRAPIFPFRRF